MTAPSKKKTHLVKSKSLAGIDRVESHHVSIAVEEDGKGLEEDEVRLRKPAYPSMMELRTSLAPGRRRTLLLNINQSLDQRVADLNDL